MRGSCVQSRTPERVTDFNRDHASVDDAALTGSAAPARDLLQPALKLCVVNLCPIGYRRRPTAHSPHAGNLPNIRAIGGSILLNFLMKLASK